MENQQVGQAENTLASLSVFYELLGTGIYTFFVVVSDENSIAEYVSLIGLLIVFGGVTGGHFNPATTLGVYFFENYAPIVRLLNLISA